MKARIEVSAATRDKLKDIAAIRSARTGRHHGQIDVITEFAEKELKLALKGVDGDFIDECAALAGKSRSEFLRSDF